MKGLSLVAIERSGTILTDKHLPDAVAEILQQSAQWYEKVGYQPPWIGYVAFNGPECVGTCGFKTAPQNGVVEIAYGTLDQHQGKGYATQMARLLIEKARNTHPKVLVTAQTISDSNASSSVLRKLGFTCIGQVQHPEDGTVWEWHLL